MSLPFLILAMYLRLRPTKKYSVVLGLSLFWGSDGVPLGCRCINAPLDPAEVGQDQSRVVGWDTWPSVLHTSHIFDA